ncbi:MAG: hypothetical protein ACHREM_14125 [Polyangiales bacterium]
MALRVVSPGYGNQRPLVLVYKMGPEADATFVRALPSNVAIANDTGPSMVGYYNTIPALSQTISTLESELGATFSPVIIAGFSEGGFATKRILDLGGHPDAVVLADATYGTDLASWTTYAKAAEQGNGVFVASHSSNVFMEPSHPSPWRDLEKITGLTLPLGTGPGVSPRPANAPAIAQPFETVSGNVTVWSYPDLDHSAQGAHVLPEILLPAAIESLGIASSTKAPSILPKAILLLVGVGAVVLAAAEILKSHGRGRLRYAHAR